MTIIQLSETAELSSRAVQLRPLLPSDAEWCYALMCGPAGRRWRYRGRTPSPEVVANDLWNGVFAQFVVIDRSSGERVGLVGLSNVAVDAGRAHGFAVGDPARGARTTEGFGLMCSWAFEEFGFSRIFLESAEFNLASFASLGEAAIIEGRLRNYELWRGRFWDLVILSITPEAFRRRFDGVLGQRSGTPSGSGEEAAFRELVAELWPLDSLGAVEVLSALEEVLGEVLPDAVLSGHGPHVTPEHFADGILESARGYIAGRSLSPPGDPSGPAASNDSGPSGLAVTTIAAGPDLQRTT